MPEQKSLFPSSPFGFGTYRVSDRSPEQVSALKLALKKGVRVLDTSTNYMDGESETAIGTIEVPADTLIISKAGYAQGQVQKTAQIKKSKGQPYPEMNELSPDLWHCISPEFLADRLTESLSRLPRVDAYLLHNPEYFLKANPDHREYYRRIKNAFLHLERECQAGRIQAYGVSSNTFIETKEHPHFTSLEVLLEIADDIEKEQGSPHHFKVIQFPFNLFENEAYILNQYASGMNLLELAQKHGLYTLANRPLNAFTKKHLVRLANYPNHHGVPLSTAIQKTLAQAVSLESELSAEFAQSQPRPLFWGHILKDQLQHLVDIEQWRQIEAYRIRPSLFDLKSRISDHAWWERYEASMKAALLSITYWLEDDAAMRSERLRVKLIQAVPQLKSSKTLSGCALRIYRSIEGLNCVLVGMRKESYVEDVLRAEKEPILTGEEVALALDAAQVYLTDFLEEAPNA